MVVQLAHETYANHDYSENPTQGDTLSFSIPVSSKKSNFHNFLEIYIDINSGAALHWYWKHGIPNAALLLLCYVTEYLGAALI